MIKSRIFLLFASFLTLATFAARPANAAEEKISFEDKVIKLIIPTTSGGSTDIAARIFARFFTKHLPGNPTVTATNMPGGHGVNALNFVVQQTKPDGLTLVLSSNSEADPITYRTSQARYDPRNFDIIGGLGFGDNVMLIRAEALPRLLDKSRPPVAFGSVSGAPRSGMRMNIWGSRYLGWNTKWVTGYPGSPDLVLALERAEIDMTSFPRFYVTDKLTDTTKYKIIYLDGLNPNARPSGRADADNAPFFTKAMEGKIKEPDIKAAYDYWRTALLFKWLSLAPKTPAGILGVYREAFAKLTVDPEFIAAAKQSIEGYQILSPQETVKMINDLAATSDEALATMDTLLPK